MHDRDILEDCGPAAIAASPGAWGSGRLINRTGFCVSPLAKIIYDLGSRENWHRAALSSRQKRGKQHGGQCMPRGWTGAHPSRQLEVADVAIAEGTIVERTAASSLTIDCRGYHVLPAIIDVHGDAFELELHPRPRVNIPFPIAMGSVDRQLLSNAIGTAYHGLTISWEPGARSLTAGREFMAGLQALRNTLTADHRVQLRWETFAHDAIGDVARWFDQQPTPAIAFNDHTTTTLQAIETGARRHKLEQWAQRAGLTLDAYLAEAKAVGARAADVPDKIREVADLAGRHGAVMLSHDERTVDEREANRGLGMSISEFPLSVDVAANAAARGEHIVMGAPNVIRGGSHMGALSAEDAIRDGMCTVLASDYYYPSQLHAAERLVARGVCTMAEAWRLLSQNPATAMGLHDRGAIDVGRRGDVVVIDCSGPWRLVHAIAGGTLVSLGS